jgi:hypothetical protein
MSNWDWIIPLIGAGVGAAGSYFSRKGEDENRDEDRDLQLRVLEQRAAMDRANFNRQNPGVMMGNSARGDVLAGAQPASFSGSGRDLKLSGGLNPGLLSANTRQLGANTSRQALLAQLGQKQDEGMTNPYEGPPDPLHPPTPIPNLYSDVYQAPKEYFTKGPSGWKPRGTPSR